MRVLNGKLSGAKKIKQAQGSIRGLSKVVTLNGKHRLFFPTDEDGDLVVASVAGCKTDLDKIGTTFVLLGDDDYEVSETGKIINKSGLVSLARIARALFKAEEKSEINKVIREAEHNAQEFGTEVNQAELKQLIKEIEVAYEGDYVTNPKDPVHPTKNPAIGGTTCLIATECYVIPLDADGKGIWEKAELATVDLSNSRITQLETALSSKETFNSENGYLEISYDYMGTDPKKAGKSASFSKVDLSIGLAAKDPNWEANKSLLKSLARDGETIACRNQSMSSSTRPANVAVQFKKWIAKNRGILTALDYESEEVKKAAKDFLDQGIVDDLPKIAEKLNAIVEEKSKGDSSDKSEDVKGDEEIDERIINASGAKTIAELQEKAESGIDDITSSSTDDGDTSYDQI